METSDILIRELLYGKRVDKSLKNHNIYNIHTCIWSLEDPCTNRSKMPLVCPMRNQTGGSSLMNQGPVS